MLLRDVQPTAAAPTTSIPLCAQHCCCSRLCLTALPGWCPALLRYVVPLDSMHCRSSDAKYAWDKMGEYLQHCC